MAGPLEVAYDLHTEMRVTLALKANICVLYHKTGLKSSEILKNVHDSKFVSRIA